MPAKQWRAGLPPRLLNVVFNGQPTRRRRYLVVSGITPSSNLGVYNNTVHTVERALLERYFMIKTPEGFQPPLTPYPGSYETEFLRFFGWRVAELVRPVATVLSDVQTVALYTGPKQRLYHNAMVSLSRTPLNVSDAKIKQFPKMEKQDLSKAPRIINPRTPRYNLEIARYLKKIEKDVYSAINVVWGGRTDHTIIKGLNCYESARVIKQKWDLFKDPVAIGLDATKWDAHVSEEALEFEHSVYNLIFRSKWLQTLLKLQLVNHGRSYNDDGYVEFIIKATRASGDINTSLGNCIIASALVWEYVQEMMIHAELCNNGDDCVVIMERADVDRFMSLVVQYYRSKGFRIEIEKPVSVFEQLEFCQTRPLFDGTRWRMMRNPLACFKKDGMCLLPLRSEKTFQKWLGAVGECGLAAASGVPVLQSWYDMYRRAGRPSSKRFKRHIFAHTIYDTFSTGLKAAVKPVTADARLSFYKGTGVAPDMQLAFERYFDTFSIEASFHETQEELYVCKSIPIIEQAPVIFDNTENLTTY